jgi:hypothetical protein
MRKEFLAKENVTKSQLVLLVIIVNVQSEESSGKVMDPSLADVGSQIPINHHKNDCLSQFFFFYSYHFPRSTMEHQ